MQSWRPRGYSPQCSYDGGYSPDGHNRPLPDRREGNPASGTSASEPDWQVDFTLDASLTVSGLRFPKAEKGTEEDGTFLLNADICSRVADMIEELASA